MERPLPTYSVVTSVAIHGGLFGVVLLAVGLHLFRDAPPEATVDLDYQVLDAPPSPTDVVQKVRRAIEPPQQAQQVKADHAPKELHDEQSDVAGTQKSKPIAQNAGAETSGTADSTPYYKIKPKYPRAALIEGLEGWILMAVDIEQNGTVENVRVIGGDHRNMFESEARRAVEKWKYRPQPIKIAAHQVRVDFKLADANN